MKKKLEDSITVHKLMLMGISASIGLSIFLFGIAWEQIIGIGDHVEVIGEDVAYMKGRLDQYWPED